MMRFAPFVNLTLAFMGTALAQTATPTNESILSHKSSLADAPTPTAVPGHPTFEIDVVFPRPNTTYNYTEYIPIIFAFQNLTAAASIGPFVFKWGIMPYNSVEHWRPGGIYEEERDYHFWIDSENVSDFVNDDGSPYYFVNSTNTTNWNFPPKLQEPSLFSLQWYLQWKMFSGNVTCREAGDLNGNIFFMLQQESSMVQYGPYPNPQELGNVTDECAHFGSMREINVDEEDLCFKARELSSRSPCNVKPGAEMVRSMSSVAAERAKPTATEVFSTPSPSSAGAASATRVPVRPMLILAGIFGGLGLPF